jgi:ribosome-binding factor A
VTGVDVSPDLSHATVRVSVMGSEEERGRTLAGLASAAGYLRSQLSRTLSARITPEVAFTLDRGLEHAERIDRVLRDLRGGAAREDEG